MRCLPRSPRNAQLFSEIVVREGKSGHYHYQSQCIHIPNNSRWWQLIIPPIPTVMVCSLGKSNRDYLFDIILFLLVNTTSLQYSKANPPIRRCWSWIRLWSAKCNSWIVWIVPQWPASRRLVICDCIEGSRSLNLSLANTVKSFTEWCSQG